MDEAGSDDEEGKKDWDEEAKAKMPSTQDIYRAYNKVCKAEMFLRHLMHPSPFLWHHASIHQEMTASTRRDLLRGCDDFPSGTNR